MAEFTPQQKAIITSNARNNLVNAVWKTGKTSVLTRKYLNYQEKPGPPKAVFLTSNALATRQVIEHLQRITALDWEDQLIGTFSEIGLKLLQKHHGDLTYTKIPRVVSDMAVSVERETARKTALSIHADTSSPAFYEQWNQEYVQTLRRKNLVTPRSLLIETVNLFTKLSHPALTNVRMLVADNVHDFAVDETLAVAALQGRMGQSIIAGNTNMAIYDRLQDIDPENWIALTAQDGFRTFPLSQCFGIGPSMGLFLQQLAAFNSKRVYESSLTFMGAGDSQNLVEVTVPSRQQMLEAILTMENQLQLGIQNRLLAVVLRNPDDARETARSLKRPCFLMWDKHRLWQKHEAPKKGIVCSTPYEVPYLNADYVALPNSLKGYWPYQRERNAENCRRLFMRAASSARYGIFFLIPDHNHGLSSSPFLSEGCTPKLVTQSANLQPKSDDCSASSISR